MLIIASEQFPLSSDPVTKKKDQAFQVSPCGRTSLPPTESPSRKGLGASHGRQKASLPDSILVKVYPGLAREYASTFSDRINKDLSHYVGS